MQPSTPAENFREEDIIFLFLSNFAVVKLRTARPLTNQNAVGMSMTSHQNFTKLFSPCANVERVDWAVLKIVRPIV